MKYFITLFYFIYSSMFFAQITPAITEEPLMVATVEGGTITFEIFVTCDGPVEFQW